MGRESLLSLKIVHIDFQLDEFYEKDCGDVILIGWIIRSHLPNLHIVDIPFKHRWIGWSQSRMAFF